MLRKLLFIGLLASGFIVESHAGGGTDEIVTAYKKDKNLTNWTSGDSRQVESWDAAYPAKGNG